MRRMDIGSMLGLAMLGLMSVPQEAWALVRDTARELDYKRIAKNDAFRAKHRERIEEAATFNVGVNNRNVRRHYARIMAKRERREVALK